MLDLTGHPLPEGSIAVIFFSKRSAGAGEDYLKAARAMVELAMTQEGYISHHSMEDGQGNSVTISCWRSMADVKRWRENLEHLEARENGRFFWYLRYETIVCRVERSYAWQAGDSAPEI